jgi:hypothetical protein
MVQLALYALLASSCCAAGSADHGAFYSAIVNHWTGHSSMHSQRFDAVCECVRVFCAHELCGVASVHFVATRAKFEGTQCMCIPAVPFVCCRTGLLPWESSQ